MCKFRIPPKNDATLPSKVLFDSMYNRQKTRSPKLDHLSKMFPANVQMCLGCETPDLLTDILSQSI